MRARSIGITTLVTIAAALLVACVSPPPAPAYPEIRFTHKTPIDLDVREIIVVDDYEPPLARPNVGHEFPVTPTEAIQSWARDRLRATGPTGIARLVIEKASVTTRRLRTKTTLQGLFTREEAHELTADIQARIIVGDEGLTSAGFALATVTGRRTMLEDLSLNQRDDAYYAFTRRLLEAFDREMEQSIRQHLPDLVR